MDNVKFGKFIVELRKEKNMTQKELAEKLNITDKAISKWERGLSFPDIVMLKPLSEIFNVSVIELLNGQRENEKEIDLDERILTILKQNEYEKNKKIRKAIGISFLSIIIFVAIFVALEFSKVELHTYNPIRAIIGYIQVMQFDKEYVEVGNIPTKTIYANTNFDIEKYMKDRGYTKLEGYSIKSGDDWYWNGEERVFIESWFTRGIKIYEWGNCETYSEQRKELEAEKYNIVQNLVVNEEITLINVNGIGNGINFVQE